MGGHWFWWGGGVSKKTIRWGDAPPCYGKPCIGDHEIYQE